MCRPRRRWCRRLRRSSCNHTLTKVLVTGGDAQGCGGLDGMRVDVSSVKCLAGTITMLVLSLRRGKESTLASCGKANRYHEERTDDGGLRGGGARSSRSTTPRFRRKTPPTTRVSQAHRPPASTESVVSCARKRVRSSAKHQYCHKDTTCNMQRGS
jgi:hypothetical protein